MIDVYSSRNYNECNFLSLPAPSHSICLSLYALIFCPRHKNSLLVPLFNIYQLNHLRYPPINIYWCSSLPGSVTPVFLYSQPDSQTLYLIIFSNHLAPYLSGHYPSETQSLLPFHLLYPLISYPVTMLVDLNYLWLFNPSYYHSHLTRYSKLTLRLLILKYNSSFSLPPGV